MKTYLWIAIAFLFLTALFVGCKPKTKTEGGGASALTLSPEGASPGMVVRVTTAQPAFSDVTAARVEIGGQPAPIVKAISATEVDVLVPNVAAGESRVKMTWREGQRGGAVHSTAGERTGTGIAVEGRQIRAGGGASHGRRTEHGNSQPGAAAFL